MEQIYIDRLRETTAYMMAHPEQHDQTKWHCGTSHCWAGFGDALEAQRQGTLLDQTNSLQFVDQYYYGLSLEAWDTITHKYNTRKMIALFVEAAIAGGGTKIDLSNRILTGVDLSLADLTSADLSGSDLSGACLESADLTDADLTDADLTDANLQKACLTDASLVNANLTNANLHKALLIDADLTNANFAGVRVP